MRADHLLKRIAASTALRLWTLLAVLAGGAAVGAVGAWVTASHLWWLAIPVALAAGWLAIADPTTCEPPRQG
jgi:hypothetical protein